MLNIFLNMMRSIAWWWRKALSYILKHILPDLYSSSFFSHILVAYWSYHCWYCHCDCFLFLISFLLILPLLIFESVKIPSKLPGIFGKLHVSLFYWMKTTNQQNTRQRGKNFPRWREPSASHFVRERLLWRRWPADNFMHTLVARWRWEWWKGGICVALAQRAPPIPSSTWRSDTKRSKLTQVRRRKKEECDCCL